MPHAEFQETTKRLEPQFIKNSINNTNASLENHTNSKAVFILNPKIIPGHHPLHPTGFRDEPVGSVFKKIHDQQKKSLKVELINIFGNNERVALADAANMSLLKNPLYDEFHLNEQENIFLAE